MRIFAELWLKHKYVRKSRLQKNSYHIYITTGAALTSADIEAESNKADDTKNNGDGHAEVDQVVDDHKAVTKVPDSASLNEEADGSDKLGAIETQIGSDSDKINSDTEKSGVVTEINVNDEAQTIKDSMVSNDDVPIISGMAPIETQVDAKEENSPSNRKVNQSNVRNAPDNVGQNILESETNRIEEEITYAKSYESQPMGNESSLSANSEDTIVEEIKPKTTEGSGNATHSTDEREESSHNSETLKPDDSPLGPLTQHVNTELSEERKMNSDGNETENTLEGTLLTTPTTKIQEEGDDTSETKVEDATKSAVQGEKKNIEQIMEESQAKTSDEGAEENIGTEVQKEDTSKSPVVADSEKDNHQGQSHRSYDGSAEVEAEVVEVSSTRSTRESVHTQEEVLEKMNNTEATTEAYEPDDNTVEKVNNEESLPEKVDLAKSVEEVTTEVIATESSPQITQVRQFEDGTEEKNTGESIIVDAPKPVEEVSAAYESVQEGEAEVPEAESEEKNNRGPKENRDTQLAEEENEAKRNTDSKPEEISKPADEVDEMTSMQQSIRETPNEEIHAREKNIESSTEEFPKNESKPFEGETRKQNNAQLAIDDVVEEPSAQGSVQAEEKSETRGSTTEVKECGTVPLEDALQEQSNAASKTEETPKPDEDIQDQNTQESVQIDESKLSRNVAEEKNNGKSTTQDTGPAHVVENSSTQQKIETKLPEEHNNTQSEEVHAIQTKSPEDGTKEKSTTDITVEEARKPVDGIIETSSIQKLEEGEITHFESETGEQKNAGLTTEKTDQIVEELSAQESGPPEETEIKTSRKLPEEKNNTEQILKPANILLQQPTTEELVEECDTKQSEDLLEEYPNSQPRTDETPVAEILEESRTTEEEQEEKVPKPVNEFVDEGFKEPGTQESVLVKESHRKPSEGQTQEMSNTESTNKEPQKLIDEVGTEEMTNTKATTEKSPDPNNVVQDPSTLEEEEAENEANLTTAEIGNSVNEVVEEPTIPEVVQVERIETKLSNNESNKKNSVQVTTEETPEPGDEDLKESRTVEIIEISEIKTQSPAAVNGDRTNPDTSLDDSSKSVDVIEEHHTEESALLKESQIEPSADQTKQTGNTESTLEETPKPDHEVYEEASTQESVMSKESRPSTEGSLKPTNQESLQLKESEFEESNGNNNTQSKTLRSAADTVEEPRTPEESETTDPEDGREEQNKPVLSIEEDNGEASEKLSTPEGNVEESQTKSSDDVPDGKNNVESLTEETPKPVYEVVEKQSTNESVQIKENETYLSQDLPEENNTVNSTKGKEPQPVQENIKEPSTQEEEMEVEQNDTQLSENEREEKNNTDLTMEETSGLSDITEEDTNAQESQPLEESEIKTSEDLPEEKSNIESATDQTSKPATEIIHEPEISEELVQATESENRSTEHVPDEQHIAQTITEVTPKSVANSAEGPRTLEESKEQNKVALTKEDGNDEVFEGPSTLEESKQQNKVALTKEDGNDEVFEELSTPEVKVDEHEEAKPSDDVPDEKNIVESLTRETPKLVGEAVEGQSTYDSAQTTESETIPSENVPVKNNTADLTTGKGRQLVEEPSTPEVVQEENETQLSENKTEENINADLTIQKTSTLLDEIVEESSAQESQPLEKSKIKTSEDLPEEKSHIESANEQTSKPENEIIHEPKISAELGHTIENENKPSESEPILSEDLPVEESTNGNRQEPVHTVVEEPGFQENETQKSETKETDNADLTIEKTSTLLHTTVEETNAQESQALEGSEIKPSEDLPEEKSNKESANEQTSKPENEIIHEPGISAKLGHAIENENKPSESEPILSEDLPVEESTNGNRQEPVHTVVEEPGFPENETQKSETQEKDNADLTIEKTSTLLRTTVKETNAQESQPLEESEIKTSEDLQEEKSNIESATEETSKPENENIHEPEISAELGHAIESENKPSEHEVDEQHTTQTTTEETPKAVTDIFEETRAQKGTKEESRTTHLRDGNEEQNNLALTKEEDNDEVFEELSSPEVKVEESETKPSDDIPDGKNNTESITEEATKLEVIQKQHSQEIVMKESEDGTEEKSNKESIPADALKPTGEAAEEPNAAKAVKAEESEKTPSQDELGEDTDNTDKTTIETSNPVDSIAVKSSTQESVQLQESDTKLSEDGTEQKTNADINNEETSNNQVAVQAQESESKSSEERTDVNSSAESRTVETPKPHESQENQRKTTPKNEKKSEYGKEGQLVQESAGLKNGVSDEGLEESEKAKSDAKPAQFITEEMSTPDSSDDEVTRASDNIVECQTTPESSEDEGTQLNQGITAPKDKDITDENSKKTGATNDTEESAKPAKEIPVEGKVEAEKNGTEEVNVKHAAEGKTTEGMKDEVVAEPVVKETTTDVLAENKEEHQTNDETQDAVDTVNDVSNDDNIKECGAQE